MQLNFWLKTFSYRRILVLENIDQTYRILSRINDKSIDIDYKSIIFLSQTFNLVT